MKISARTLSDQMQLTDREIEVRRRLFNITDEDARALNECKPYIERRVETIVEKFYQYQLEVPEIDLLIGDAETLRRLKDSMSKYVLDLFGGYYDAEYVNKRLRIGKVHKRIGVQPKLYISTVNILHNLLDEELETLIFDREGAEAVAKVRDALRKVLMFDIQLVFDTYINSLVAEVESAKTEVEEYAATLEETIAQRTEQLELMSRKDPLSNLFNQRAFYEELRRELARAKREETAICLVYIDLNGFKEVNDTQGHQAGDKIIQSVAKSITNVVRIGDVPCRYGGDEFSIIMPGCDADEAQGVCKRLFEALGESGITDISLSIGVVQSGPTSFSDTDDLVRAADTAMYKAKASSRVEPGNYIEVA